MAKTLWLTSGPNVLVLGLTYRVNDAPDLVHMFVCDSEPHQDQNSARTQPDLMALIWPHVCATFGPAAFSATWPKG